MVTKQIMNIAMTVSSLDGSKSLQVTYVEPNTFEEAWNHPHSIDRNYRYKKRNSIITRTALVAILQNIYFQRIFFHRFVRVGGTKKP